MNFFGSKMGKAKPRSPLAGLMQPNLMEMLQPEGGQERPLGMEGGAQEGQQRPQQPQGPMIQPPPPPMTNQQYGESYGQQVGGGAEAAIQKAIGKGDQNGGLMKLLNTPIGGGKERAPFEGWGPIDFAVKPNPLAMPFVIGENIYSQNKAAIDPSVKTIYEGTVNNTPLAEIIGNLGAKGPDAASIMAGSAQGEMSEAPPSRGEAEGGGGSGLPMDPDKAGGMLSKYGGMIQNAAEGMMQKYGDIQDAATAKEALRKEFQDTPELDAIINKTESELATARAGRKQPGLGDFLVLALMNLSNKDFRNNADMVLGTSRQEQTEGRLEDRLAQLEGGRASAKMHGRQSMRAMGQQQQYQQLQAALKQQEMGRKQHNEDRDFGLRANGQKLGVLKSMLGSETGVVTGMVDDQTRKKALESRNKLKKALGLDDAGLDEILRQKQQSDQPQDDRQSRMFGDMIGGAGYA